MNVSLVILLGTAFVVLGATSGYQHAFHHNHDQLWLSQQGNNYQYHYPYYGFNHPPNPFKWEKPVKKSQWQNPMKKSLWQGEKMKSQWQNPMSKPQWQNAMSKPQWQNPLSKPQWQLASSKPQWKNPTVKSQWKKPMYNFRSTMPSVPPSMPTRPVRPTADISAREWPDYIPPIRMIKLPLDTPPAA